jgi:galactose-1-phosphate uridylyltransferase
MQVIGLQPKHSIAAGSVLTKAQVNQPQVIAMTDLETGHLISATDRIVVTWQPYNDMVFNRTDELLNHYTLAPVSRNQLILRSQVRQCQAVAARPLSVYHVIESMIWWLKASACQPERRLQHLL